MELKLDPSIKYALALEGGGAKGAYDIGVWKALREAGIQFCAVSGTSVGALNGGLIVMGDLEKAEDLWLNIRFSQVMDVNDEEMRQLFRREIGPSDITTYAKRAIELIRNRGFDVTPLHAFIAEVMDEDVIRASDIAFYIITYSVTDRKTLELRASDLKKGELADMMLASAYLPAFRNEKLGGKRYADGGVQDAVPVHALVANGYRDILVVRMYGYGLEKHFRMPKDARVTTIAPTRELGGVLNFTSEQSRFDLTLGYFDAKRTLYGLAGSRYYIDRGWDEEAAYAFLRKWAGEAAAADGAACTLRELNEKLLPRLSKALKAGGDYYSLAVACLECAAEELGVDPYKIYTEENLLDTVRARMAETETKPAQLLSALTAKRAGILRILKA